MRRLLPFWLSILILLMGALGTPPAPAQPSAATKTLSDTVALTATGSVEIDSQEGSITVSTWDRAEVGYEVTLEPGEGDSVVTSEPAIVHTKQSLSFDNSPGWSLRIPGLVTISPGGTNRSIPHYRIVMPTTAALSIYDQASTIDVTGLDADLVLDTHEGTATVDSVEGTVDLDTHEGSIQATAIRGGATVDTHEGAITVSFDEFSVPSRADTHSGQLRFFLPPSTGFELVPDIESAELTIDEAFGNPTRDGARQLFNGGGPEFEIETFSGAVELLPSDSLTSSPLP